MDFRVSLLGFRSPKGDMIPSALLMWIPEVVAEHLYSLRGKPHYQLSISTNGAVEPTVVLSLSEDDLQRRKDIVLIKRRIRDMFQRILAYKPHIEVVAQSTQGAATTDTIV